MFQFPYQVGYHEFEIIGCLSGVAKPFEYSEVSRSVAVYFTRRFVGSRCLHVVFGP